MNEETTKENFWTSKAGPWGIAVPAILIVLGLIFSGPILAGALSMFTIAGTVLGYGVAWGIIGVIAFLLIHGLFIDGWLMLWYQIRINNLRKAIIDENPLTILRIWKQKAEQRMVELRSNKDNVKKQELVIKKANDTFKADFLKFQSQANTLEGDSERIALWRSACGQMATAYEMAKKTGSQLESIRGQYKRIDDAVKDLEAMYQQMEYEEKALIIDYETSGALDKAWSSIRKIFKGENEEDKMREEAIASINNKYAERMGRVESAISDCQGKFDEIKLSKEVKENDGIAMFNQLKNVTVDQLSAPTKAISYNPVVTMDVTPVSSYTKILNK